MNRMMTLFVALTLMTGIPTYATAHTSLSASNIVAGSEVSKVPDTLELTFAKAVGLAAVELMGPDDETRTLQTAKTMDKVHRVALPALTAGRYIAKWRAVASDGHVMSGEIPFTVVSD